jgi:hypothetical protein
VAEHRSSVPIDAALRAAANQHSQSTSPPDSLDGARSSSRWGRCSYNGWKAPAPARSRVELGAAPSLRRGHMDDEELVTVMKGIRPSGRVFASEVAGAARISAHEALSLLDEAVARGRLSRRAMRWFVEDDGPAPAAASFYEVGRTTALQSSKSSTGGPAGE